MTQQPISHRHVIHLAAIALSAALLLSACGKSNDATVGQQVDAAVAKTEQKMEEAKAEVKQETAEVQAKTEAAADKLSDKAAAAVSAVTDKVEDASITASINAELAKDPALSALRINVDTVNGSVILKGTAPDATARDRATQLASSVKGVSSVDNRLEIRS